MADAMKEKLLWRSGRPGDCPLFRSDAAVHTGVAQSQGLDFMIAACLLMCVTAIFLTYL